jgi:hypothetical protein
MGGGYVIAAAVSVRRTIVGILLYLGGGLFRVTIRGTQCGCGRHRQTTVSQAYCMTSSRLVDLASSQTVRHRVIVSDASVRWHLGRVGSRGVSCRPTSHPPPPYGLFNPYLRTSLPCSTLPPVPGFYEAVRGFIAHTLVHSYGRITKRTLADCLKLDGATLEQYVSTGRSGGDASGRAAAATRALPSPRVVVK